MADEQDSSIFHEWFQLDGLIYQLHDSASDHNVNRQLFCLHGHCDKQFWETHDSHSKSLEDATLYGAGHQMLHLVLLESAATYKPIYNLFL
jgi:hypothetical protein